VAARRITIFDTTLRDGEQSPGIALQPHEKAEIATQLERLGVDVVEAGFAVSSPGDFEGVRAVAAAVERPAVASLARTRKEDIDAAAESLADAQRSRIHVFIATSPIHMEKKLRLEPAEVVEQACWAVGYANAKADEVEFSCEVDLGSERVHLTGSADRVERDHEGRIRIVDFKTSKSAPTAADIAVHDQLGVYQLAVQQGGFAAIAGEGARPAGAELVYLRLADGENGHPRTFQQASLDDVPFPIHPPDAAQTLSAAQPTWVHRRLAEAAQIIRNEDHDARIGPGCRYCPFRTSCPAQPAGQQVVK